MLIDKNFVVSELKNKINVSYHNNVFNEGKPINSEWMNEPQKPENLVEQIFLKILDTLKIPKDSIIFQKRIKLYDLFKDKNRYPDFKLIKDRLSEKNLLIELEPYNSNIQKGVSQAIEWIQDISIGTFNNALVINLREFFLIFFDSTEVKTKELSIEDTFTYISEIVFGKKPSIRIEDINKITEQFYNQFYALIHGGSYVNINGEKITISIDNSILKNLAYDDRLKEPEKIEFVYSIFNRLIFIKILMDWELFPKIFPYLKNIPSHLIQTELNNLFFRTLAVKKDNRQVLPDEFANIPFLNGGLFRTTEIEKKNPNLMIKPKYLLKIFDFLEEYTFIENGNQNSSINSEILGYIFEKTIEFRKGTGSYYTHKLICDFMCENILYPHLLNKINIYLKLIGYKDAELLENFEEIFMLREKTLKETYEKIVKKVKVCDICVGSGAFLLAMGNLLLEIHKRILKILHLESDEIELKQFIVEYNLYGVDIMLSAIQICQLRLWLWISEKSKDLKPLPNIEYNLRVGNSLLGTNSQINISTVNYKFINKIKESKLFDERNLEHKKIFDALESGVINFPILKELKIFLLDMYIYSHDETTFILKDLIEDLNELIIENADRIYLTELRTNITSRKYQRLLTETFLRRNKAFHWYLEFPYVFPKGFDIIVGNPPYISIKFMEKIPLEQDIQDLKKELNKLEKRINTLKKQDVIEKYRAEINNLREEIESKTALLNTEYYQEEINLNALYKEYLKNEYSWASGIYDILIPFFERGFNLLKSNDSTYLSFITSNKFLATDYGKTMRHDFLVNYQIDLLVDISMIKVFKDAAVYPIIITLKNGERTENAKIKIGRYNDINDLGESLVKIDQERYNRPETNFLIYMPLNIDSFLLFNKLNDNPNCFSVNDEFDSYYRPFDFTNWGMYEAFKLKTPGKKLGEDYYLYVTNNDIHPFQINTSEPSYFHRIIPNGNNPNQLVINQEKWSIFNEELLLIKEVALDLICAIGKNYANIGKIYALKLRTESCLKSLSNYYFLALFNSKLLDFYYRVVFWNTHLSGGYLNYHFSYLSILPILKIDSNSKIYQYIVFLSKCLTISYEDLLKDILDELIIHAYFPNEFEFPKSLLESLDRLSELDNLIEEEIINIVSKLKINSREIDNLKKHSFFQILIKERQFKAIDEILGEDNY